MDSEGGILWTEDLAFGLTPEDDAERDTTERENDEAVEDVEIGLSDMPVLRVNGPAAMYALGLRAALTAYDYITVAEDWLSSRINGTYISED